MKKILEIISSELNANRCCTLCVIVKTQGATPRKAMSKMLVLENGTTIGSVGGGSIEQLVISDAKKLLNTKNCEYKKFSLSGSNSDKSTNTGMICGGDISVLSICFDCDDAKLVKKINDINDFYSNKLNNCISKNNISIVFSIVSNKINDVSFINCDDANSMIHFSEIVKQNLDNDSNGIIQKDDKLFYYEKIASKNRVIIFGAGHIAAALAQTMVFVDYDVVIYDFRDYLLDIPAFDKVTSKIKACFDSIDKYVSITSEDNIVVATPSHSDDFTCLSQIVGKPFNYAGCLGSTKKTAKINQKLIDAGFKLEDIKKIDSPIGINIGAQTPNEIAISIAAKIIDCNNIRKNW